MEQRSSSLEGLVRGGSLLNYYGKRILVTGHTGFKGSWLCLWLNQLGAKISGYALKPPTTPNLFQDAFIQELLCDSTLGDVRDMGAFSSAVEKANPEVIFHLAAQSLVRVGYENPLETLSTNIMGTVNLLEIVRQRQKPCIVIVVTTDKCYANNGQSGEFSESDPMGGDEPYSASKGATELVVHGYRQSFFVPANVKTHGIKVATVRAGNVIGGGDWAVDRIVPDIIRAIGLGETVKVRNPLAVRPWQHVLEPLAGYLRLGEAMMKSDDSSLLEGWNFGPDSDDTRPVQDLVREVYRHWPGKFEFDSGAHPLEAGYLTLSSEKARRILDWYPCWTFADAVKRTVDWYRNEGQFSARERCEDDLRVFSG